MDLREEKEDGVTRGGPGSFYRRRRELLEEKE